MFILGFNTKIKAISRFAFYSEVKIKEHLKLTRGAIPGGDKACILWEVLSSFWVTLSRNFSQKNKAEIVNKVILGVLHLIFLRYRGDQINL